MRSRKSTNRAMKSNTVKKREANGRAAKDRAVARTPLWSRILIGIVAMACLCAGIAAGANLIAVTAFDDATSQLNGNLKAASKDDADLSTLSALQQKADARFADAAAWSALLLPQVKDVIDTNASVSATLTERINAQLQKQQNTETSNAQTTPGSDGNAKQSGGLTQEQRKQDGRPAEVESAVQLAERLQKAVRAKAPPTQTPPPSHGDWPRAPPGSSCPVPVVRVPHHTIFDGFLGWCGNAGIRAFSRIIGKWRFL